MHTDAEKDKIERKKVRETNQLLASGEKLKHATLLFAPYRL